MFSSVLAVITYATIAPQAAPSTIATEAPVSLSPVQMFNLAEQAERTLDVATAEAVYRALATNPSAEIRSEARFRHALLLEKQRRYVDGATLLRQILDEDPGAQRVRIELASLLAKMGDESGARRELRAVQAGRLPPEVAQWIDRFSAALRARKPFGGSLQLAVASDSNINRATRSDTVGTVIGDFILDDDAKAKSGNGVAINGQAYARLPLGQESSMILTAGGSADVYRDRRFNDITLFVKASPQISVAGGRMNVGPIASQRWFGGSRYTSSLGATFDFARPIAKIAQARLSGGVDRIRNYRNALESGWIYTGSLMVEAALSPRSGLALAVSGIRRSLRDGGYSNSSGQATVFGYREFGHVTATASASISRLVADQRLVLYPDKRAEWLWRGTLGATFRQLTLAGFAPTAQVTVERNRSSIEIYDYRRTTFQVGVTRAF